ncbi:MAG: pyrroline-5-carboxylate reductase, partial [Gemmatimonadetes bacterium]|nr:pyrroline-5-carboxylate reductase [Gemmatimonadota bacterium]
GGGGGAGDAPGPLVRAARAGDVAAIARLLGRFAERRLVRARTAAELHREAGSFLVADATGGVVGCVALRIHSPAVAEIASLAVDEAAQGGGIGHRLVRAAVLRAHALGVRQVFAFTRRERFFGEIGFRPAPIASFRQKLAADYGGFERAAAGRRAFVLELEPAEAVQGGAVRRPSAAAEITGVAEPTPRTHERRSWMVETETAARPAIAILGGGNLGRALAMGWVEAGYSAPERIWVTRRQAARLAQFAEAGLRAGSDNREAVAASDVVVLAVQPQQLGELLDEIADVVEPARHRIISVVSGVTIGQLRERLGGGVPVVRAMPNTAVAIGESMTCLSAEDADSAALREARELFDMVGRTLVIPEEMMIPATALCACGVAFFLRSIRAASQGGIEIGFHPEEALFLAAQTAKGAASLLLSHGRHPESEIDQVTTPRGCTIAGLNEMEHQGFSSAMIKGILLSAAKAEGLYRAG